MTAPTPKLLRCAVYTRVSTDTGLEQDFNSLDAQREACEAYIKSQTHEGWRHITSHFDDGGFSGGIDGAPCAPGASRTISGTARSISSSSTRSTGSPAR